MQNARSIAKELVAKAIRTGLYVMPPNLQNLIAEEILLQDGYEIPFTIEQSVLRKKAQRTLGTSWSPSHPNRFSGRVSPNSLLRYAKNIFSQCGDDGILEVIFERLGIRNGYFVEFGAWDGIYLSNSRLLFCRGWNGAFIEGDSEKFDDLQINYQDFPEIKCIREIVRPGSEVTVKEGRSLDQIWRTDLKARPVDFLSIDIDGLDHLILENLEMRPTVICIEVGFFWHPDFTKRVPESVAARNLHQPLSVLFQIASEKDYVPVCFNQNTFLVDRRLEDRFTGVPRDVRTLWMDAWYHRSDAFREYLRHFRSINPDIRQWEGNGVFASLEM